MKINPDCRYFKGDVPCLPHKKDGVHCEACPHYDPIKEEIIIIKTGAAGDVIRTTPILRKIKQVYPRARITWVTEFPSLVPASFVDKIIKFSSPDLLYVLAADFDLLYSLDKDYSTTSLASLIKAKQKIGYALKANRPAPLNDAADAKYLTGLFDDVCRENKKHYVEEIFEICGFKFAQEEYILDLPSHKPKLPAVEGAIIGLNTGCGLRWAARLWPDEKWVELIGLLSRSGYKVLLLGGPQEDDKNKAISAASGALYWGIFPLDEFIQVINACNLIVTQVTMALHLAIALKKKIVLMNNAFNRHEFYLYGLGGIIEPDKPCLGCYKGNCQESCMSLIEPEKVMEMIEKELPNEK